MGGESAPAGHRRNKLRLCLLLLAVLSALLLVHASLRARPEVLRPLEQQQHSGEPWLLLGAPLNPDDEPDLVAESSSLAASGSQQETDKSFKRTTPDEQRQATIRPSPEVASLPTSSRRGRRSRRLASADRKCRPR